MHHHLINLQGYTPFAMALNLAATSCWIFAYILIVRNGYKNKFIDYPFFGAAGSLAWETLWSFVFKVDMGILVDIGVKAWFAIDLVIFIGLVKYGSKQTSLPEIKRHYHPILFAALFGWGAAFYAFVTQGFDTPVGGRSALMLNLTFAICWLLQLWHNKNKTHFMSLWVALAKWWGTAFFVLFVILYTPDDRVSIVLGSLCFIVDLIYFLQLKSIQAISSKASPAAVS